MKPIPDTFVITNISLINNQTGVRITGLLSPSALTVTLPDLQWSGGDSPVDGVDIVKNYVQKYLDQWNQKTLADYAANLKAITFSS